MASVSLERVWINLASDPSQSLSFLQTGDKAYDDIIVGEVRSYANGRERLVGTATKKVGVQMTVVAKRTEYDKLSSWRGKTVLYRDESGLRLWCVFLGTSWKPLVPFGSGWRQVSVDFQAVSYDEAV